MQKHTTEKKTRAALAKAEKKQIAAPGAQQRLTVGCRGVA